MYLATKASIDANQIVDLVRSLECPDLWNRSGSRVVSYLTEFESSPLEGKAKLGQDLHDGPAPVFLLL